MNSHINIPPKPNKWSVTKANEWLLEYQITWQMDINSDCALDDEFVIHDNAKKSKLDEAMASKAKYNSELQGSWWREIPML